MADLTKSRAHKPLAISDVALSRTVGIATGRDNFSIGIWNGNHWFTMTIDDKEAVKIAVWLARGLTSKDISWSDYRTAQEVIRELADKLEQEK